MSEDRDVCHACGDEPCGWLYFCCRHGPLAWRTKLADILAVANSQAAVHDVEDMARFIARTIRPTLFPNLGGMRVDLQEMLRVGSVVRTLFDLGRMYERQKFDALAQSILEVLPAPRKAER